MNYYYKLMRQTPDGLASYFTGPRSVRYRFGELVESPTPTGLFVYSSIARASVFPTIQPGLNCEIWLVKTNHQARRLHGGEYTVPSLRLVKPVAVQIRKDWNGFPLSIVAHRVKRYSGQMPADFGR